MPQRTVSLFLTCCSLLLLGVLWTPGWTAQSSTFMYRDRTGDETVHFCWRLERMDNDMAVITSRSLEETFVNICRPDGSTRSWEVHKPGVSAKAVVEGGQLVMEGRLHGEAVAWDEPMKGRTWYQPLSFALRNVARGEKAEAAFFCLRPDTLEPASMKAERKGVESIEVNGRQERAVKVRVRLQGLLAIAWHGDYWFRTGDWVFVRYEGVNGPPGTPKTVIELIQEKTGWEECRQTLGCRLAEQ